MTDAFHPHLARRHANVRHEAVVVIARNTQEAIVVNLPSLHEGRSPE